MSRKMNQLKELLEHYQNAPKEFQATNYWASYEKGILDSVKGMDFNQMRSGKYPILATFGFNDVIYTYHPSLPKIKKMILKFIHNFLFNKRNIFPYRLQIDDIREIAFHHCELLSQLTSAKPISNIEVSSFGNPKDIFNINGHAYTMPFLSYYIRYCFAQKHIIFKGDEILVELGPGSGYQIEVLKKLYPGLTILCFDLPAQIYLCEIYLSNALGSSICVGTDKTIDWQDLSGIQKGKVHFFGNWKIPLLKNINFDIFWNAASFGEMEPEIVKNYLNFVKENAQWIYLLQARHGKETTGKTHVQEPIILDDYSAMLSGYELKEEHDAWQAHGRLSQSGGYFEGVWKKSISTFRRS